MTRKEDGRSVIWYRLFSDPAKKIEWEVSEYVACAVSAATEAEFRITSLRIGIISYLTTEDLRELGDEGYIHKNVRAKTAG